MGQLIVSSNSKKNQPEAPTGRLGSLYGPRNHQPLTGFLCCWCGFARKSRRASRRPRLQPDDQARRRERPLGLCLGLGGVGRSDPLFVFEGTPTMLGPALYRHMIFWSSRGDLGIFCLLSCPSVRVSQLPPSLRHWTKVLGMVCCCCC